MNFGPPPYFPSDNPPSSFPLERYLPPYQQGVLKQMLNYQGIQKGWLLDPIGSHPLAAIDLAKDGFQVFVACNNPIIAKIIEVICHAYSKTQFQGALSEFGSIKIGEDRLETSIRKLYQSECPNCHTINDFSDFIWKKGDEIPTTKEMVCTVCKQKSESRISEIDLKFRKLLGNINLYRSRSIQRVIPGIDVAPPVVEEVIQAYLPRSLAVLTKFLNRNDAFNPSADRKRMIEALLILACDYGTMLWGIPIGRSRPKSISIPNQFRENNLWKIMEIGYEFFSFLETSIPFTIFPDLPPESGGICLFPNRIRRHEEFQKFPDFQAVSTVLPRPNQAFWTLCAVWAGWLWGPDTVQKLKGALERKRYDWIWHTHALKNLFEFTSTKKTPWVATAPELSPNFMLSFASAPASSGYQLNNFAFHPENKSAQLYWQFGHTDVSQKESKTNYLLDYMAKKGEHANYQELLTINILHLANSNDLVEINNKVDNSLYPDVQHQFENFLNNKQLITKIDKDSLEYGDFWLTNPPNSYRPLADQIEISLIHYLQDDPIVSVLEIESIINKKQPGVFPVHRELLMKLLESYCDRMPGVEETWQLRKQETINIRQSDIRIMKNTLISIGEKLGANVISQPNVIWEASKPFHNYHFFVTASCILSRFITNDLLKLESEFVIVYPGSRAELLNYKIRRDPILANQISRFHFVKFRHLRKINEIHDLNFQTWESLIDSDPIILQEFGQPVLF